jgi:hypothetical protein
LKTLSAKKKVLLMFGLLIAHNGFVVGAYGALLQTRWWCELEDIGDRMGTILPPTPLS